MAKYIHVVGYRSFLEMPRINIFCVGMQKLWYFSLYNRIIMVLLQIMVAKCGNILQSIDGYG
jgi:hypothetical protein